MGFRVTPVTGSQERLLNRWGRYLLMRMAVLTAFACGEQDPAFTEQTEVTINQSEDAQAIDSLPPETDLPPTVAQAVTDAEGIYGDGEDLAGDGGGDSDGGQDGGGGPGGDGPGEDGPGSDGADVEGGADTMGIGLGMVDAYTRRNFVAEGLTTFSFTDDDMINYLTSVKGPGNFSISTITGTRDDNGSLCSAPHSQPQEEGMQYISAAGKTGGIVQSICDTDWSNSLARIGVDLDAQIKQVALLHTPKDGSLKVYVNDVETTEWTFQSGTNAVKFNQNHIPVEGDVIKVTYLGMP